MACAGGETQISWVYDQTEDIEACMKYCESVPGCDAAHFVDYLNYGNQGCHAYSNCEVGDTPHPSAHLDYFDIILLTLD